jgi:hypothetical protein
MPSGRRRIRSVNVGGGRERRHFSLGN